MLVAERNRLGRATGAVRPRIEAHLTWLRQEVDDLDQELRGLLRQSPLWREQDGLLRSVPSVGPQVSLTLPAYLPELGMLDRRPIAALVGVAPINRDSGAMRGKRTVWGGRARVRAGLYMGALVASRYNPVIRALYQLLVMAGKAEKGCAHRMYAQAVDHSQRHGENRTALESNHGFALIYKTVAFSAVFTGWLSMIAPLGVASPPSLSRTLGRSASSTRSQVPSLRHFRKYHQTVPQGGRSWGIIRRGMPPRKTYSTPLTTSRRSEVRGWPLRESGGNKGSRRPHWALDKSVGYVLRLIFRTYTQPNHHTKLH